MCVMVEESVSAGSTVASEARDRLIRDALVAGMTYAEAGDLAGVSARSVRRLMSDESFRSEVRLLRVERSTRLSDRLSELGGAALRILAELMEDDNPAVRMRAVQTALTLGSRARREVEMSERIDLLERSVEGWVGSGTSGEGSNEVA